MYHHCFQILNLLFVSNSSSELSSGSLALQSRPFCMFLRSRALSMADITQVGIQEVNPFIQKSSICRSDMESNVLHPGLGIPDCFHKSLILHNTSL